MIAGRPPMGRATKPGFLATKLFSVVMMVGLRISKALVMEVLSERETGSGVILYV